MTRPSTPELDAHDRAEPHGRSFGFAMAVVWLVASGLLAWVGTVLAPTDVESMEGFERILFTIVPIRAFSWAMAGVFAILGLFTLVSALRRKGARGPMTAEGGDGSPA